MLKVNQDTYARVFASLLHGPACVTELVIETGLERRTLYSLMKCLHKHKVVHIAAWERDSIGRECIPVWAFGIGRDVKRKPKTAAENTRAYRARQQSVASLSTLAG